MLLPDHTYHGDCLKVMKRIEDKSIDMILCDLPYSKTAIHWDKAVPLDLLWQQYNRIIKDNGAIVLTASQPFTSAVVMSNPEMFRYELIWDKERGTNPILANKMPMNCHENILVFYKNFPTYNPQYIIGKPYAAPKTGSAIRNNKIINSTDNTAFRQKDNHGTRVPLSILHYPLHATAKLIPTAKPVLLFEYLIRTYTNTGDLVLDNTAGSGTTAIACIRANRHYILIEKDRTNIDIIRRRIKYYKESNNVE